MTSHHDVAGATSALRSERNLRRAWRLEVASLLESQAKALSEARAKLFPYADATEISGMSWSGFYLIGDKKSIRELKRLEHRSAQLEAFSKEYDLRTEALEARALAAEARLAEAMKLLDLLMNAADGLGDACNSSMADEAIEAARAFTNAAKEKT